MKCKLDHGIPGNFRITDESWEVSKVRCHGSCDKDFETKPCNSKNQAWVCEGNKMNCCFNIVFCNNCYFTKLFNYNEKRNGTGSVRGLRASKLNK